MNLRRKAIENADAKPRAQQRCGQVRADEAGASGDECVAHRGSDRRLSFQRAEVQVSLRAPQIRVVDLLPVLEPRTTVGEVDGMRELCRFRVLADQEVPGAR